jgi:hypothetical protein
MREVGKAEAVEILLGALFEGSACDGPWVQHCDVAGEMEELAFHKHPAMAVPYQYLLITLASDQVREVTRQTARAVQKATQNLLGLLEAYDQARQGDHADCAKFAALLKAPFPVNRPSDAETRDPDVVAVILRQIRFGGSWDNQLNWLALQEDEVRGEMEIERVRRLAAFEEAYGIDLADLLFSDEALAEQEALAREIKQDPLGLPSLDRRAP